MKIKKMFFTIIAASMLMLTACGSSSSSAESSEAPAQTIRMIASQNNGVLKRARMVIPFPSSVSRSMEQVAKFQILYKGISAQIQARILQCSIPNTEKKNVDRRITPTEPQQ